MTQPRSGEGRCFHDSYKRKIHRCCFLALLAFSHKSRQHTQRRNPEARRTPPKPTQHSKSQLLYSQLIHSFIHSRTRIILLYNREFINLSSTAARQYSRWLHQWPFSLSLSLSFSSPANKHRFLLLVVAAQKRNWFDPKKRTSRSRIIILD